MSDTTVKLSDAAIRRRMLAEFWFYFSQNRGAVVGLVVFSLLVVVAIAASVTSILIHPSEASRSVGTKDSMKVTIVPAGRPDNPGS